MNLSKRQKMMLAVLGVALGAFLIDAMLPGPSAASAGVQPEGATHLANPASMPVGGVAPPVATNAGHEALMRVVDRLRSVHPGDASLGAPLPDPFAASRPSVLSMAEDGSVRIDIEPAALIDHVPSTVPARLPPTIRISSIMNAPEGRLALIDGQLRREGDRLGDWMITRIAERSIRLSDGTHEVRVPMDR